VTGGSAWIALGLAVGEGCVMPTGAAIQTRMTATGGGEYTLYPTNPHSVPQTVQAALASIQTGCRGAYEIVSLGLVPTSPHDTGIFLDLEGKVSDGPFRTVIAFECRQPENDALNRRLLGIAGQVPPAKPPRPAEPCLVTYDCPVGRVCAPTEAACAEIDQRLTPSNADAGRQ
jgi:hypothetical protein